MKSKIIFIISLCIMIVALGVLFTNLWIYSGADWIIRVSGIICLLDIILLTYSYMNLKKGIRKMK
jgi:hypothetical protein